MKNACEKAIKNIPPAPTIYKVVFGGGLPIASNIIFKS
jgi:hypothetical protein